MKTNNGNNMNTMNITNMSEEEKMKGARIIEKLYKYVCPNGTHKTMNGKHNGIITKIERVIRKGRWESYLPYIYKKEVAERLVADLCNGKDVSNLRDYELSAFIMITCHVNNVIRFGEEKATAIFTKACADIIGKKMAVA